ncbi:Chromatin modification-related protein EAF3 [Rhodotorula toruloides ATCC 204091]|uniref:BY PROTMAP: gi/342321427/gb/EGU13361.1/ Chromatin modification-related protein EAF3 [Rhodotorula glutinis ATCC 204091] n=1 Tax=Rhodotorula toruloides TaxID=5286 RepID=A0A0K3CAI5_RHOTO|nr:Chromatin modification-related protein EAF3 [Rhodotorula toruloides ATCC 204091]KAK4331967.1 Non-specific serine/threonine protein kinase [Rhodotorula toruloides]
MPADVSEIAAQIDGLLEGQGREFSGEVKAVLRLAKEQAQEEGRRLQAREEQATKEDKLLADLGCTSTDSLVKLLAACRLLGGTVPPSLASTDSFSFSSSEHEQTRPLGGTPYAPEPVIVLPELNEVLGAELLDYLHEILDPDLCQLPLTNLPLEKREFVHAFLSLLQPEDDRDCFPIAQSPETETKWHIFRLRAIFASFIRLVNAFSRAGTPRFVFGTSHESDVFRPDCLVWLGELYPGDDPSLVSEETATPRLQLNGSSVSVSVTGNDDDAFYHLDAGPGKHLKLTWRRGTCYFLYIDSDLEASDGKSSRQCAVLDKIRNALLSGPPTLRLGNCCDADFSFTAFALSIYPRPPDDAPPPTKKRKQRHGDEALLERQFIREDQAIGFLLVLSPLVRNDNPDLLRALLSFVVPHSRLQARVAKELVQLARHVDFERHIQNDLQGTLMLPPPVLGGFGASMVSSDGAGEPALTRNAGVEARPSGAMEKTMPLADGGGDRSTGRSGTAADGQLTNARDTSANVKEDSLPASTPLRMSKSPSPHSSPAPPPLPPSVQPVWRRTAAQDLDYLAVTPLPVTFDWLPEVHRPAPAKPTRWIRFDKPQLEASSTGPEISWTELVVVRELTSSPEYRFAVAALTTDPSVELIIKEEYLRYIDDDPMNTPRNEAATYEALKAAGLGSVCAPYVGLYKVVDGNPKLALVTERWGEPLKDFELSEDERMDLGEMLWDLHDRGFYHGDFAARNVLVDSERKFRLID